MTVGVGFRAGSVVEVPSLGQPAGCLGIHALDKLWTLGPVPKPIGNSFGFDRSWRYFANAPRGVGSCSSSVLLDRLVDFQQLTTVKCRGKPPELKTILAKAGLKQSFEVTECMKTVISFNIFYTFF